MFKLLSKKLQILLNRPQKVLHFSLIFVALSLILDGSLLRLWSFYKDHRILKIRTQALKEKNDRLVKQIALLSQPEFLETEIRKRFDLTNKNDLIFVFPKTK